MSINLILDEIKYANEILDRKHDYLSDYGVAKYLSKYKSYEHYQINNNKNELNIIDVYDFVINYLKEVNKNYNCCETYKEIMDICKKFSKKDVYIIKQKGIKITKNELNKISSLKNNHLEILAFVILVLKKIDNVKQNKNNNIFDKPLKDFYQKYTKDRRNNFQQNQAIKKLIDFGLLSMPPIELFGKTDELKINYIDFDDNEDNCEILINDFREIDLIYLKWKGKNVIQCEECGRLIIKENNKMKYCKNCAKKIERENTRNRVEKYRKNTKVTK